MTTFANARFDFDFCEDDDAEHTFEIFEVRGGKVVGYADDAQEAERKITELEAEAKA